MNKIILTSNELFTLIHTQAYISENLSFPKSNIRTHIHIRHSIYCIVILYSFNKIDGTKLEESFISTAFPTQLENWNGATSITLTCDQTPHSKVKSLRNPATEVCVPLLSPPYPLPLWSIDWSGYPSNPPHPSCHKTSTRLAPPLPILYR